MSVPDFLMLRKNAGPDAFGKDPSASLLHVPHDGPQGNCQDKGAEIGPFRHEGYVLNFFWILFRSKLQFDQLNLEYRDNHQLPDELSCIQGFR